MADYIALATSIKRATRERLALELAEAVLTGKLVPRVNNAANAVTVNTNVNASVNSTANTLPVAIDRKAYMRDYMRARRAAERAKEKPGV